MLQIPLWNRLMIVIVVLAGLSFAMPNLFYDRVERHNDAVAVIEETGATTDALTADRALWPDFLPSTLVNLGLDLRGGAHLLAEVQVEDVYEARMDGLWPEVRDALRDVRDEVGTIRRQNAAPGELHVRISEPAGIAAAVAAVRELATPVVGLTGIAAPTLEVLGENDLVIVTLSEAERQATDDRTMQQSVEIVRRRVDEAGTREPTIQRQGADRILIQVPGIGSAQELKDLIGTTARLTFHPVVRRTTDPEARVDARQILLPSLDEPGAFYVLEQTPVVTGDDLVDSQPAFDQQTGQPAVTFRFNPSGARDFGDYTAANIGAPFAIVLDDEVISAPVIRSAITGGSGQITGQFHGGGIDRTGGFAARGCAARRDGVPRGADHRPGTGRRTASRRARWRRWWPSPPCWCSWSELRAVRRLRVGRADPERRADLWRPEPDRGDADPAGDRGDRADHRHGGGRQRAGLRAHPRGAEDRQGTGARDRARLFRALSAIVDANLTTFIIAVILFVLGSGPVRGFSMTLGIGIITSVFTAIYVTRLIIVTWFDRARPKTLEV